MTVEILHEHSGKPLRLEEEIENENFSNEVKIKYEGTSTYRDILDSEVLIYSIQIISSISLNILSSWIYDKIKNSKKVWIDGKEIDLEEGDKSILNGIKNSSLNS